jgi:hypothetical protein
VPARGGKWQGAKWCWPATRLAIYLRDGLACVWCSWSVEDGASLTLDHLTPHCRGGSNAPTNLVTACKRCNDTRGAASAAAWAVRHGKDSAGVRRQARRALARHQAQARELLSERRTVAGYLAGRKVGAT